MFPNIRLDPEHARAEGLPERNCAAAKFIHAVWD